MFRRNVSASSPVPKKKLGEILLDEGIISQVQLKNALERQSAFGGFLGQILVDQRAITQDTLISYLAKQCQIPHLSLFNYRIGKDALAQVPKELCLKHYLLPVDKMGRILTLAMVDPMDDSALSEIKQYCPELRIKPVLCSWDDFQLTVKQVFAREVEKPDNLMGKYLQHEPPSPPTEEDSPSPPSPEANAPDRDIDYRLTQIAEMDDIRKAPPETLINISQALDEEALQIVEEVRPPLEVDSPPQEEKNEHLAQIAQAALDSVRQAAQLLEAHAVTDNNRNDLLRQRPTKHASVAPFMGSDINAAQNNAALYSEQDARVRDALDSEHPLETLTFDNFFAGETNRFTVKLAREVAEKPGGDYNPLFLYGKVGLGKTHLISAIGNANITTTSVETKGTGRRIGYISASHFARRLSAAIADSALELFRDNYCHWDMLILDDIQFLGGRVEAQEEFFHIFNVLQQQGRQIIIAGDKAPDRLGMLEQRLVSRFASGIVAELKAPEWETRMKILRYNVNRDQVTVPEEVLSLVAMRVPDDIRKMMGALRKIIAFARLEGGNISVEDAQKILSHLGVNEAA